MKKYKEKFGFRSVLAPATKADIARAETELGKKIPKEYLEFLMEWNGGYFTAKPEPIFCTSKLSESYTSMPATILRKVFSLSFLLSSPLPKS